MTLRSAAGKLLDTMSFTYFFIEGDTFMASLNGISNVILSNAFLQIVLSNSRLVCVLLGGKGGRVLYTLSIAGSAGVEHRSPYLLPTLLLPPRGRWPLPQCWAALSLVGVENGCDEVNVQIPAKYKSVFSQQIMLGQENVTTPAKDRSEYDDRNTDEPSAVITLLPHMHAVRSLHSDRASVPLGRYVATERPFHSVAT
ncbi:hypothetical protein F2Q69_00036845 [Brassica cretica]|uniref:Uncharacterized protein n=1 Tax=Brassica cretica TaxID=69181 RepID=A0A8S9SPP3_BRACR|nr:hypothetical protein F2Q69_00036845 [Brassica cretica]